ncbi:hypothetical protein OG21DRAFT_1389916, partial [Imleria badia]
RYFSPLTQHSVFSLEHAVTSPPLMQHKIFPCKEPIVLENAAQPAQPQNPDPIPVPSCRVLIPKPWGEVSRINRGGYNLHERLGWQAAEYEEI